MLVRYPLYHGMRSKKTADQIKKEGFCSYNENNEAETILRALKVFNKNPDNIKGYDGDLIRMNIETVNTPHRKVTWASADKTAACGWWAHANPEHISDSLFHAGVEPRQINDYLNKQYGNKCYSVKLRKHVEMSPANPPPNVNIGLNCIPPEMIEEVRKCGFCDFDKAKKIGKKRGIFGQKKLGSMFGFEW